MDDGETSEWFETGQELRPGCLLDRLPFDLLFTPVLNTGKETALKDKIVFNSIARIANREKKGRGEEGEKGQRGLGGGRTRERKEPSQYKATRKRRW